MNTLLKGLVKSLSDSDVETRDMGVAYLMRQIPETKEGQLSELDMAKIWRGLFFCMWHSDGPFVQDALAEKLGSMVCLWPSSATRMAFARAFFAEMRQTWDKIDDLRADKFRRLVRCVVTYVCRALVLADYDAATVAAFRGLLCDYVLDPSVPEFPVGLAVYVLSILLDALDDAAAVAAPARAPQTGTRTRTGRRAPAIAFEETLHDSAAAVEADDDARAEEEAVEHAGDSMQRLQLQIAQTRRAIFVEAGDEQKSDDKNGDDDETSMEDKEKKNKNQNKRKSTAKSPAKTPAKNAKKQQQQEQQEQQKQRKHEPGKVDVYVTEALLDAVLGYLERGLSRTVVNAISEHVLDELCCADRHPRVQRDMDAFLERLNARVGDEAVMRTPGGPRLAHYYARIDAFRQRGWAKRAVVVPSYEAVLRGVERQFDRAAALERARSVRRHSRFARGGKAAKRHKKLKYSARKKAEAKRAISKVI